MKKILSLIGLGLGLALFTPSVASAQDHVLPHGAVLALTQPNPAKPIEALFGPGCIVEIDGVVFVTFTIQGIGQWDLDEYTNAAPSIWPWINIQDWTRNAAQPTQYTFAFDAATFVSFVIHLENVHGLSVVYPPSAYRHN